MPTGHYRLDDAIHTVTLTRLDDGRYRAVVGERELIFTAVTDGPGRWRLLTADAAASISIGAAGDVRHVVIDGEAVLLTRATAPRARRPGAVDPDPAHRLITAQMPGQVRAVLAAPGDEVRAGQPLAVLEAMKMELRVTAPVDGRVTTVHVEVGQVVGRGQRLFDLG